MLKTVIKRALPAIVWFILGALLAWYLVPAELEQMKWEIPGTPDEYPLAQLMRPFLHCLFCFLPFIGAVIYAFMGTTDRYMTRNFMSFFMMCTFILLLIYLLADFTDNMERLRNRGGDQAFINALKFYGSQLPMILYQILPYTLMMGTMWCLSKLSGTCEITGMMQSGRSLLSLCRPIFIFGTLISVAYGIFGYHWAPNGMLYRQMYLKQERRADGSPAQIFYQSDANSRHWIIEHPTTIDNPGEPMNQLQIKQFDKSMITIEKRYYADKAVWDKENSVWTLYDVYVHENNAERMNPQDGVHYDVLQCAFSEKPYQILSPGPGNRIESMGTAVLHEYISSGAGGKEDRYKRRTEWHVRIAKIFTCMVLVLLAIPSSVTFQRRGTMKGIGIAIILAALMLFLYRVFPALGEAGIIQAWISAWIPNVVYTIIAVYIFRKNLAHRSLKEWLRARMKGDM